MKTKVRITKRWNGKYKEMLIQFLTPYSDSSTRTLRPACTLNFLNDNKANYWFGPRMVVDTDRSADCFLAAKIMKVVESIYCTEQTPDNILAQLNAEEHVCIEGEYLPITLNGGNAYNLFRNEQLYTTIYAHNHWEAVKMAEKECKMGVDTPNVKWRWELKNTGYIFERITLTLDI